mmetsp:Transcript_7777/g.18135  ORF Transcript_7777/g.18135 Transcript_7777/m.18135 type:complete len:83 (+) Transcript_7777:242-490(+)
MRRDEQHQQQQQQLAPSIAQSREQQTATPKRPRAVASLSYGLCAVLHCPWHQWACVLVHKPQPQTEREVIGYIEGGGGDETS